MRLDIVIPAHNEQHRIGRTLDAYRTRCTDPATRLLVALDRCTDDTADVVAAHAAHDSRIAAVGYPKLGKGGVLIETLRRSDAELVGFVDADCATPPSEFLRLVDVATTAGVDGAIASRRLPASVLPGQRRLRRRLTSAGFAFGTRRLFGLPFRDTQCGAKVLRRDVAAACVPYVSSRDFLFDVDLLFVASRLGFDIAEVPTVWVDRDGSTVRAGRDAGRMAVSAIRLWLHHQVLPVPGGSAPVPASVGGGATSTLTREPERVGRHA